MQLTRVLFLVSRDWQVRRNEAIIEHLHELDPLLEFFYLSEEEWSLGNASRAVPSGTRARLLVLPRSKPSGETVWTMDFDQALFDEAKIMTSEFLTSNLGKIQDEARYVLFYDGLGALIEGYPSQLVLDWLRKKDFRIVSLQHGFLVRMAHEVAQAVKRRVLMTVGRLGALISTVDSSTSVSFVYGPFAKFLSWVMGSRLTNIFIVGNLNILAVPQATKSQAKAESIYWDDLVIFSPGSYKNRDTRGSQKFEQIVESLCRSEIPSHRVCVKLKSGERQMMPEDSADRFRNLGIVFLSEDLSVSEIHPSSIIACSSSSNVGLELVGIGREFFVYELGSSRSQLQRVYRRMGVPRYNPIEQRLVGHRRKQEGHRLDFDGGAFISVLERVLNDSLPAAEKKSPRRFRS